MNMNIKIDKNGFMPTKGTDEAAGFDLYSTESVDIRPHETVLIGTGVYAEIPKGYFGGIYARSGIALKKDLAPANKIGVVDSDYRGEIKVALHNHGEYIRSIDRGERIAQLIIQPYLRCNLVQVDDLEDTERGSGGFGSTGE
ncbi:MAG: dUTP diphosphatase [Eubacterium sp.]|nr:dUTP diphosphatase [Eubacterium sp.]